MKSFVILVITGAMRIVTKGLKKNLETIPGNNSTDHLKNILGRPHIIMKVLSGGIHHWFKRRSTRKRKKPVIQKSNNNNNNNNNNKK
jgi:hypothetical protein